MNTRIIWSTVCFVLSIFYQAQAQDVKTKPIFNGKNLKGWVVPENNLWWTVNDGILSAKSDPDKIGSILWTKKDYRDFVLEADFLMGEGVVDSGFFLRSDRNQVQIG